MKTLYSLYAVLIAVTIWTLGGEAVRSTGDKGKSNDKQPPRLNPNKPPGPAPEGMVWIPGGEFWMGSKEFEDSQPIHKVYVDGFWMDKTEVTNAEFEKFVKATGYKTVAERWTDGREFPALAPEKLGFQRSFADYLISGYPNVFPAVATGVSHNGFPASVPWGPSAMVYPVVAPVSIVFERPRLVVKLNDHSQWWKLQVGASWRHPEGPKSNLKDRENHPAVHICWEDAVAYAKWADKRLPTEAEWEFAARGGLDRKKYCWGDQLKPGGKPLANIWEGDFPIENKLTDGFAATAPVGSYPPNGYGLYDTAGNVREWCADWYQADYYKSSPARNPPGPRINPRPKDNEELRRVQRGGSFLCADNYCLRYVPGARGKGEPSSAANHVGFRCVRSANTK